MLYGGMAALAGLFFVFMVPYRLWWHTVNPAGGIEPDTATWIGYSAVLLAVAAAVKTGMVMHARTLPPVPEKPRLLLSTAKCAAKGHPGHIPVESSVNTGQVVALWCPSCETQLEPDWKPAGPGERSLWSWRWECTCGETWSSLAYTETGAQAAIRQATRAHEGTIALAPPGSTLTHHWEYKWWPGAD